MYTATPIGRPLEASSGEQRLHAREACDLHPQPLAVGLDLRRSEAVDHVDDAARDAILAAD